MKYKYDIAISFAGEERKIALEIATSLQKHGLQVFYDGFEESSLLGENLFEYFHSVYSQQAQYCIILVSKAYLEKTWTTHERRSAQERALNEKTAYILPFKIDGISLPGLHTTTGYYDLSTGSVQGFVEVVLKKLGKGQAENNLTSPGLNIPLPKHTKAITDRDKDKFLQESFGIIKKYFATGIQKINMTSNLEGDYSDISGNKFSSKLYSGGTRVSGCTIWIGGLSMGRSNSICYSNQADQESSNSMNEILTLEVIDNMLSFKATINMFYSGKTSQLSPNEAAEYLWAKFIDPINR